MSKKIVGILIVAVLLVFSMGVGKLILSGNSNSTDSNSNTNVISKEITLQGGNFVIPTESISSTASFYKVNVDGTDMEILAIKASDGTIRTAFNTCQVCYDSGRGYYKQNGYKLVCQNCGNSFTADQVEASKNGCNPVPITDNEKVVDATNITISIDVLTKYKTIFENWKS